jgi:hypothetical protein
MFSLSYLPTAERLTVVIVKARNLKLSQNRESGDSFVKVSAVECSGLVCYGCHSLQIKRVISTRVTDSARNGNFEVPVYFLKSKQGYTVRKMKKNMDIIYNDKLAARSKVYVCGRLLLEFRVRIPLRAWMFVVIINMWLYSPIRALPPPQLGFRNNNLFTGLDC